jgi:hypothetical protein
MTTVTDSDLQELKDLISGLDKRIEVNQTRTDEKLDSIEKDLSELKKQTEKQDNRLWVLISGMFLALVGLLTKVAFFPNP